MVTKILAIQKGNNVIVYSVDYKKSELKNYLDHLTSLYSHEKKAIITTEIIDGKVLSMSKYDLLKKYCDVDEEYTVIEELGNVDEITKLSKIEITVRYRSMVSEIIKEVFMNDKPLINTTELIKLTNHVLGFSNFFLFNKMLDLDEKNKAWNDPSRGFLNITEYNNYLKYKQKSVNVDNIKLNKVEEGRIKKDMSKIIEELHSIINIEQIGMFPIQSNDNSLLEILRIFGERNTEFELFYDSLEDVDINLNGASKLENYKEEILNTYDCSHKEDLIKEKIDHYSKVKSFLKF